MSLATLRGAKYITQAELAARMGVSQGDVSRLESREDLLWSSVARYARALGGVARITVQLGDRQYVVAKGSRVGKVRKIRRR